MGLGALFGGIAGGAASTANQLLSEHRKKREDLSDEERQSEISSLEGKIKDIQTDTKMAPEAKAAAINDARRYMIDLHHPNESPKLLKKLHTLFGTGESPAASATVPGTPAMEIGGVTLPGGPSAKVKEAPRTISDILAMPTSTEKPAPAVPDLGQQLSQAKDAYKKVFGTEIPDDKAKQLYDAMVGIKEPTSHPITKVEKDDKSPTGYSYVTYDPLTGVESHREGNAPPQRGLITSETNTESTDQYGNVIHTTSTRTPILPGDKGTASPSGRSIKPTAKIPAGSQGGQPQGLTPDGHIPEAAAPNAQVREAANQLLDGTDREKLPVKVRVPASMLARQYGWEQGKFTPKEQLLLKESSTFLEEAVNSPSLSVLDDAGSRLKLQQLVGNPEKRGFFGKIATTAASANMNPQEAEFIRMYNQLVGTVSGLSQLVRSGRATEAQIERLKAELPNPYTTQSADDAKKRIQRLMEEVDIAKQKGTMAATQQRKYATFKGRKITPNTENTGWVYADKDGNPTTEKAQ